MKLISFAVSVSMKGLSNIVPIALTNMVCSGYEDTIMECSSQQVVEDTNCDHGHDLIISCLCE